MGDACGSSKQRETRKAHIIIVGKVKKPLFTLGTYEIME